VIRSESGGGIGLGQSRKSWPPLGSARATLNPGLSQVAGSTCSARKQPRSRPIGGNFLPMESSTRAMLALAKKRAQIFLQLRIGPRTRPLDRHQARSILWFFALSLSLPADLGRNLPFCPPPIGSFEHGACGAGPSSLASTKSRDRSPSVCWAAWIQASWWGLRNLAAPAPISCSDKPGVASDGSSRWVFFTRVVTTTNLHPPRRQFAAHCGEQIRRRLELAA